MKQNKPNVIFVFSDQHRLQSTGFAACGDGQVLTPHMNKLAKESINFTTAVSGCPVCSPYRASLITGRYPLTHGVFVNDVCLNSEAVSIADAFKAGGYSTAYIGKWHLDGHGRSAYIPKERRQGFEYWKVLECTHEYNASFYYENEDERKKRWDGYDAISQTEDAKRYIKNHDNEKPFLLMLSFGPPHNPYQTAPRKYKDIYNPCDIKLRKNVPICELPIRIRYGKSVKEIYESDIKADLAGYYAHISAVDAMVGEINDILEDEGLADNTIFIYTSDHGDMLFSHGESRKQKPWDESILVPFLMRYPKMLGKEGKVIDVPFGAEDIMPTLLEMCELAVPETVEGVSFSSYIKNGGDEPKNAEIIQCIHPFGECEKRDGGREYRGIRTKRYTYVADRQGPWLLYDNLKDPYQLNNLCNRKPYKKIQSELAGVLAELLAGRKDEFLSGEEYIKLWGYNVNENGTVPYKI